MARRPGSRARRFNALGSPYARLEDRVSPSATPFMGPSARLYTNTEIMASIRAADPLAELQALGERGGIDAARSHVILTDASGAALVQVALARGASPLAAVKTLEAWSAVDWATPNYAYVGDPRDYTPNDPQYASQYHHTKMQNNLAWDITTGDPSVVVAIADDGVAVSHPDLAANLWVNPGEIAGNSVDDDGNGFIDDVNGWDTAANDKTLNPVGSDSHGTHVAGIVAARTNNNVGVAGVAGGGANGDGVRIMPIRWYGEASWTASMIANTYTYAANNGAKIVNASYNFDGWVSGGVQDPTVKAGMDYAYSKGLLLVNSAGNNGANGAARGAFDQVLFVASTDSADVRSSFSNYGEFVDIASPGSGILSTVTDVSGTTFNYDYYDGTSMATPDAAGVAALIWSMNPTWTREQVVAQLMATADNLNAANPAIPDLLGAGRTNSYQAVTAAPVPPKFGALIGLPAEGGTAVSMPNSFYIRAPHRFDPATVTGANFELRGDGLDNTFGTADDNVLTLSLNNGQPYLIGVNTLNFTISGSAPADHYRFRATSGGLKSVFNLALDGNGDGTAGDDYTLSFDISRSLEGVVFRDRNGNGVREVGEVGVAGFTVFDDINGNGVLDNSSTTVDSTNVPVNIVDFTTVTSKLTLSGMTGSITDANVKIDITHTYDADLTIRLISPGGTPVDLALKVGGSANNFTNTIFDDQAALSITAGAAPFTGSFRPQGLLSALNGSDPNGTWTLEVTDGAGADTGTINAFSVTVTAGDEQTTTSAADGSYVFATLSNGSHTVAVAPLAGWNITTAPATITAASGKTAAADFGVAPADFVFGRVFNDVNGNGVDDAEAALANWAVFEDTNGNGLLNGSTTTVSSTNVPVAINGSTTHTSTITVADLTGVITDVDVKVNINHVWDGDLRIFVVSPTGAKVELSSDNGGSGDNYTNTIFDDEAGAAITSGAPPYAGTFRPEGLLSTFDGSNPNGVWTLQIVDTYPSADNGTLTAWSLTISYGEASRLTDANGYYEFPALTAGAHTIARVLQPGYVSTAPVGGVHSFTHVAGATQFGKNFGQRIPPANPPARVNLAAFNGTDPQRSNVTTLKVGFDQHVTLPPNPADAFTLNRQGGGGVTLQSSGVDNSGPGTIVTLTFSGAETELGSLSLKDGEYTLGVLAAMVSNANGNLDGNNDGSGGDNFLLVGDTSINKLYRLFGDTNGDGFTDNIDFVAFRAANGSDTTTANYNPVLDFNNDGFIDNLDFIAFRERLGMTP